MIGSKKKRLSMDDNVLYVYPNQVLGYVSWL